MSKQFTCAAWLLVGILSLSLVGGCSCWKDPLAQNGKNGEKKTKRPETLEEMEARRKELQEKKDEKPDFETTRLAVLPLDDAPTKNQVKPGHWFSAIQTTKANNFDFTKGDLEAQCVDPKGQPIPLPGTQFDLSITRPVSLPKGQTKHFDLLLFANMPPKRGAINFITRLRPRGGGREVEWKYETTTRMKPFQNHFVVLAALPDNYQFVKALRSVKPERQDQYISGSDLDYFVKLPKGTRRVDLPSHPLTWSNMAYVLWDDFEPEILNTDQQQALIDWLHWGGQLIINGPRTLDRLSSSILAPYLPARTEKIGAVTDSQIAELNRNWSFPEDGGNELRPPKDEKNRPVALELTLQDGAQFIEGTGELIAEKDIGRGRVVTTAFNIPHSFFQSWDSYDCLFNSCLLRRPGRTFSEGRGAITENWVSSKLARDDPRLTSGMRYFSRDAMGLTVQSRNPMRSGTASRISSANRNANELPATRPLTKDDVYDPLPTVRMGVGRPTQGVGNTMMRVVIDGATVIRNKQRERYSITFQNVGNDQLITPQITVTGTANLIPVEGTGGGVKNGESTMAWMTDNILPGYGNTIEVIIEADTEETKDQQLRVEFVSNYGRTNEALDIELNASDESLHPLVRSSKQAFGLHGFAKDDLIGVAGWSDSSEVSRAARESLKQASGISVPSKFFIAKVLGIYLLILVPLNWLLFKVMGRVEWAWAAVPVIAIGGALGVVKAAELDIGFARSRTEISIVEVQPDYDRGHATRYSGFYTSLSSRYRISGEDTSTLLQPFLSTQPMGDRRVGLYQGENVDLSGFNVISNSTGYVHSEQMLELGGTFSFSEASGQATLQNDTNLDLKGAAVVRRVDDSVEVAWVGDLRTKEKKVDLSFEELSTVSVAFDEWDQAPATSVNTVEGELNIRKLIDIATDPKRLGPEEMVLVGWNDAVIEGLIVKPEAAQVTSRTVVVAQLNHAKRPAPTRDTNSYAVLKRDWDERKKTKSNTDFDF